MQLEPWINALWMEKVITLRQQPQQVTICIVCQANWAIGSSDRIITLFKPFLCFRIKQLWIGIKSGFIQAYFNSNRIAIRWGAIVHRRVIWYWFPCAEIVNKNDHCYCWNNTYGYSKNESKPTKNCCWWVLYRTTAIHLSWNDFWASWTWGCLKDYI